MQERGRSGKERGFAVAQNERAGLDESASQIRHMWVGNSRYRSKRRKRHRIERQEASVDTNNNIRPLTLVEDGSNKIQDADGINWARLKIVRSIRRRRPVWVPALAEAALLSSKDDSSLETKTAKHSSTKGMAQQSYTGTTKASSSTLPVVSRHARDGTSYCMNSIGGRKLRSCRRIEIFLAVYIWCPY